MSDTDGFSEPVGAERPPEPPRHGLPWESAESGHSARTAAATLRLVLFAPSDAFARMLQTGGLADPLLYLMIFGTLGSFFGLLWQSALRTFVGALGGGQLGTLALDNTGGVVMLVLAPLLVLLGAAIAAAIYHLMLLLLGGAPKPFETTLRVVSYASGSTYVWLVLPICGGVLSLVWFLVAVIVGLARAHEVPGGRAAAAVLGPVVLFCFCCAIVWLMVVGAAVAIPAAVQG